MSRLVVIVLAMLGTVGSLRAEVLEDADSEAARRHFTAGCELYQARKYVEALRELELARRIKPMPELDYNLARTYEHLEDWARAVEAYERYLPRAKGAEAQEVRARVKVLKERLEPLKVPGAAVGGAAASVPAAAPAKAAAGAPAPAPAPTKAAAVVAPAPAPTKSAVVVAPTKAAAVTPAPAPTNSAVAAPAPTAAPAKMAAAAPAKMAAAAPTKMSAAAPTKTAAAAPAKAAAAAPTKTAAVAPAKAAAAAPALAATPAAPAAPATATTVAPTAAAPAAAAPAAPAAPATAITVAPAAAAPAVTPELSVAAAPAPRSRRGLRIAAWSTGVFALAAAGAGAGLLGSAGASYDSLETTCAQRACGPADWRGTETRANAGYALLAVGGAAAAVDVFLFWRAYRHAGAR